MTDLVPFRALRYQHARVELDRVLAPVYDVVAPQDRPLYYDRDPHNALRLELTRSVEEEATTDYADVARSLAPCCDPCRRLDRHLTARDSTTSQHPIPPKWRKEY